MGSMSVTITEEFDDALGRFVNYDAYDLVQKQTVHDQSHVDIRSFIQDPIVAETTVFDLLGDTMGFLDTFTMAELSGLTTIEEGEEWTGSVVVGPDAAFRSWHDLQLTLA